MEQLKNRRKKKFVRNKTIKWLVIDAIITSTVFIIFLRTITPWLQNSKSNTFWALVLIAILVFQSLLTTPCMIMDFGEKFETIESRKYVEKFLLANVKKEVVLIKAKEYNKFILSLYKFAKFYAIINEKNNCIDVEISLNDGVNSMHFESVSKDDFRKFYKLK